MKKEIIAEGRTVDEALEKACAEAGIEKDSADFEIIAMPKKALFKAVPAKVKIIVPETKESAAREYLTAVLGEMGVTDISINTTTEDDGRMLFTIEGEGLRIAIGRHGETLDALQYLTSLVINKVEGEFLKISIDIGDYRQKREETLTALAKRVAAQAIKNGRNITLEPMNPYERRVIHAAIQKIDGVSSKSIGDEPRRKVVVCPDVKKPGYRSSSFSRGRDGDDRKSKYNRPRTEDKEDEAKVEVNGEVSTLNHVKDEAADKPLYGKIDLG
ncbi:MAG: protein jag [Oscillospiraceae bacterium]|nr:protein jag [Oscillospiraceae bacterium]